MRHWPRRTWSAHRQARSPARRQGTGGKWWRVACRIAVQRLFRCVVGGSLRDAEAPGAKRHGLPRAIPETGYTAPVFAVTYLGQQGWLLASGSTRILIDPLLTEEDSP